MENKSPFYFFPHLIVRTPRLPFLGSIQRKGIQLFLNDPVFLESIYLASPVLYHECIKWKETDFGNIKNEEKITNSLAKYFLRSSTRCTPFGLFAGCSTIDWHTEASGKILKNDSNNRHTRLDMQYLCTLAKKLTEMIDIRDHLLYFPNNSIYKIGNELRYIEYVYIKGVRSHQISSVQNEDYVLSILTSATTGITRADLIEMLAKNYEVDREESISFIDELISSQLIVSELDPCITGREYLFKLIETVERIKFKTGKDFLNIADTLSQVRTLLTKLDDNLCNDIKKYKEIIGLLETLDIQYDEARLFQVDVTKMVKKEGLNSSVQINLQEALNVLNKLSQSSFNTNLKKFAKRFYDRYNDREMPLLQVLDTETGIGYLDDQGGNIAPLIEGLSIGTKNTIAKLEWNAIDVFLNKKLQGYLTDPQPGCIEIKDEDLDRFKADWDSMPPSLPIMFKLIHDQHEKIYIESIGGSSAINLMARFAHADNDIEEIVREIAAEEHKNNEEVIFAEIVHLPESRTANVLLHPPFRDYEIPYLAQSSLQKENQIDINDLYISIRKGSIFLRSKRFKKQIVPRLSTAHNFSFNALPVYQFLCDMQTQDYKNNIGFNWGSLESIYKVLPRVEYKKTILSAAIWNFNKEDIRPLFGKKGAELIGTISIFRQSYKLPKYLVLADYDNELLIDMDNEFSISLWLGTVKNRESFKLKEFLIPSNKITDNQDNVYANQFIAAIIKNKIVVDNNHGQVYKSDIIENENEIGQSFILGSEWLYYKIYCGAKTADKILTEIIKPLCENLLEKDLINKWFFIRFNDPKFHIRLRFNLKDISKISELAAIVNRSLQDYINEELVWNCQTDTYNRELERYGKNAIHIAEDFFFYDSVAVLSMLNCTEGDEREEIRWLWAVRSIDELLNCFGYSLKNKLTLSASLRDSFSKEHNMDRHLMNQINNKYRFYKSRIVQIMNKSDDPLGELFPIIEILYEKNTHLSRSCDMLDSLQRNNKLDVPVNELVKSYLHMMLNRIIATDQRMHEMVIYHFICRYYESEIALRRLTTNV